MTVVNEIVDKTPEKTDKETPEVKEEVKAPEEKEIDIKKMSSEELRKFARGEVIEGDSTDDKTDDKTDDEDAQKDDDKTEDKKDAEVPEEKEAEEEMVKIKKSDLDKKDKQIADRGDFIKKLKTEKREAVKTLTTKLEEQQKIVDEATTAGEAATAVQAVEKTKRELNDATADESVAVNREVMKSDVPDFESKMETMSTLLRNDGYNEQTIKEFNEQPYIDTPILLKQLYERAVISDALAGKDTTIEDLQKENKLLKDKPNKILDNIEKAANRQNLRSGSQDVKNDNTSIPDGADRKAIASMTRDELRKAAKGD